MSDQNFSRFLEANILKKRWSEIKESWSPYLAKSINITSEDNYEITPEVINAVNIAYENGSDSRTSIEIEFLQPFVLQEAITMLKKAANVVSCAQSDVLKGYKTWSVVNAYHGAFFAARSILAFLGITYPTVEVSESKTNLVLVDLFPGLVKQRQAYGNLKLESIRSIVIAKPPIPKIEQRHYWLTLQRYLNVLTMPDFWPEEYLKVVRNIDFKGFGKQRNFLFYGTNSWLFDDLVKFELSSDWGILTKDFLKEYKTISKNLKSDFSVVLSLILLKLGYLLFENICSGSQILNGELAQIRQLLESEDWHPLYIHSFA